MIHNRNKFSKQLGIEDGLKSYRKVLDESMKLDSQILLGEKIPREEKLRQLRGRIYHNFSSSRQAK